MDANYPDSDIIVIHEPSSLKELIVHRIIAKQDINRTLYFRTKGEMTETISQVLLCIAWKVGVAIPKASPKTLL